MKINASDFLDQFLAIFLQRWSIGAEDLVAKFRDTRSWTDFMLNDKPIALLPEVLEALGRGQLEYRREFKLFDLCAWLRVDDPYHKPQYDQPLYIQVCIEHENRPTPEEEFWKLLHFYSPLKVLVCYPPRPDEWLQYFDRVRAKVSEFHPRSPDEEYLVIVGPRPETVSEASQLIWKAWSCASPMPRLEPIPQGKTSAAQT